MLIIADAFFIILILLNLWIKIISNTRFFFFFNIYHSCILISDNIEHSIWPVKVYAVKVVVGALPLWFVAAFEISWVTL